MYADLVEARRILGLPQPIMVDGDPVLTDIDQALAAYEVEVREIINRTLGRGWSDVAAMPEVRYAYGFGSDLLILPKPAVALVAVRDGDTALDPETYEPALWESGRNEFRAIRQRGGHWWGGRGHGYAVEAIWADQITEGVPAPVRGFATWAVCQLYRRRSAGVSGQLGPEGYTVIVDDVWKSKEWASLKALYRVRVGVI